MTYTRSIQISTALSVLLHLVLIGAWNYLPSPERPVVIRHAPPIELDLQPDVSPQTPRTQLVDVTVPAPQFVPRTPLIAEDNAEAMDETTRDVDTPSPELTPDDFNQLAAVPAPPEKPVPRAEAPIEENKSTDAEEPETETERAAEAAETDYDRMESALEAIVDPVNKPKAEASSEDTPIRLAKVDPTLPQRPSPGKSSKPRGVSKRGMTNFDAIQSEIAPYLKQVRAQVEREWNTMLYTRYTGTSPVKAVIDCAISPSGELISVTVSGTNNDRIYSALCRDAVKRAGPFGPFTFEVPDIYRDKNLEIRWTFSFH